MREKVTLEFMLPVGKSLKDEESESFVKWIGTVVALARMQGIGCELYVNGKHENVTVSEVEKDQ